MENNENNLFPADDVTDSSAETDDNVIKADNNYDADMWISGGENKPEKKKSKFLLGIYDFVEMLALVTIAILLCFSFVFRLNIVEGPSMENTLHTGEYLLVSDLFYEPTPGDIVVIHDLTAGNYTAPLVKRVIATEGQIVDIDFDTWTLKVDGKTVDESLYRYLDPAYTLSGIHFMDFPITIKPGHVFVMGDNRNHSADSRLEEIGQIDERCIVGKAYARIFPLDKATWFKNPYDAE
ncbi:MAG: signal peptidase I [Clostridia bacterium]|nr:signal peptidase I [Clostridia bacterium]MBR5447648.1 signal peptidase I [Clostridia bacterium]